MFFQPMLFVTLLAGASFLVCGIQFFRTKNGTRKLHWSLRAGAALLILFAGLRPTVPTLSPAEVYNSSYDVYFVVDLTSSMVAEDWNADGDTRLEGVREDINDILDDYAGAKFSLITFNSSANLRVPLTPDSTAIASAVNTMLPEVTAYSNGSSISEPLETLQKTLAADAAENEERARIVLYFGDGEQTSQEEVQSFEPVTQFISQATVYGYGTEDGGRMKTQNGYYISSNTDEYITDAAGNEGLSVIDQENLQNIAEQLDGDYQLRNADNRIDAPTLSDEQKLDLQQAEGANINNTVEYYWILLIPVALILFVETGRLLKEAKQLGVNRK